MERIVKFHEYCPKCVYFKTDENEDPCKDCISVPAREDSRKPEHFKEADKNGN